MKPLAYLIESVIYITLIVICLPYAYISYGLENLELAYANTGAVLFMLVMYIIATVDFVKSLKEKTKRKGSRFK